MKYKWLYTIKYSDRNNYPDVYKNRYNSESTYRYDFCVNNSPAFVVLQPELVSLIMNIQTLDKRLYQLQNNLPDMAVSQFARKCLIDEVKQTNDLEGVVSTKREIKDILDNNRNKNNRHAGIVLKYNLLMQSDSVSLKTCNDIRFLYNELVLDEILQSDAKDIPDGDIFRKDRVYVKDKNTGRIIHEGLYPETAIINTMSSLLTNLNNPDYNPFINIAVFHYMFGYIHPFYDGNGRTDRFISSYLMSKNLEFIVSFRLAYTIKKDINKYYKMFKLTNDPANKGDLTPFSIYFLELIEDSLKELVAYFTEQTEKLNYYFSSLGELDLEKEYKDIISILIQNDMFGDDDGLSVEALAKALNISTPTIRKRLHYLDELNYLKVTKTRPFLYNTDLSMF